MTVIKFSIPRKNPSLIYNIDGLPLVKTHDRQTVRFSMNVDLTVAMNKLFEIYPNMCGPINIVQDGHEMCYVDGQWQEYIH